MPNYYRMNTFYTEDVKVLKEFLDTIGEQCRKEVTSMDLSRCMSGSVLKLLPQLHSLRELHLNYYLCRFGAWHSTVCDTMENLEVVKLAPYLGCNEHRRQSTEKFITTILAYQAILRDGYAELAELDKLRMLGSTA